MFKVLDAYVRPEGLKGNINLNLYRIYKNPEARALYMKAQYEDIHSIKQDLYQKMGEYELVEEKPGPEPKILPAEEKPRPEPKILPAEETPKPESKLQTIKEIVKGTIEYLKAYYNIN